MAGDSNSSSPSKGQAWFCTTDLPSDIVVEVDDITFYLHKFPLVSKSKTLYELITEQEAKQMSKSPALTLKGKKGEDGKTCMDNCREDDDGDDDSELREEDCNDQVPMEDQCRVSLPLFPGGSAAFETAAKFCYGVKTEITAGNVAALRCAGEVLQMTEEYAQDNLISMTEKFLIHSVFNNIKDSIRALNSCEGLSPLAENLGIVHRCVDAISSNAAFYHPAFFGWPVNEVAGDFRSRNGSAAASPVKLRETWVDDLAKLSSEFFNRTLSAMREKEIDPQIIESCLMHYAKRRFPGICRSGRITPTASPISIASEAEQRKMLENLVLNLPSEKSSPSSTATMFLFGLLRTANILNTSDACKSALERKIGRQLEQATLDDLLIPSYSYLSETLYDVDCVQRMLRHFIESYEEREIESDHGVRLDNVKSPAIMLVGKLIDGYLSEIASDANLKPEKLYELATSLPEQARLYDDGVYRAIDVYLKAHPWITEGEREKITGVMNFQKLTLEACTHAAQNQRLPLRSVVQVLFFEQLQLRHAISGTLMAATTAAPTSGRASTRGSEGEEREKVYMTASRASAQESSSNSSSTSKWREAMRENQVLRLDMDSMRTRVKQLERDCSTMKKVIEKIDNVEVVKNGKGWRSKFGCKLTTRVCNSHESTVVHDRKVSHRGTRC